MFSIISYPLQVEIATPVCSPARNDKGCLFLLYSIAFLKRICKMFDILPHLGYNISATGSDSRGCKLKSCR